MLSAIDQSFSVYFSHANMDIWLSSMQFKPTYVRLYSSVFYTNMHCMMISCVTEGYEYSAKQVCTVTLLNTHHTYYMHQWP